MQLNCLADGKLVVWGAVVWIPDILMKGIVTSGYSDSNQNPPGPKPPIYYSLNYIKFRSRWWFQFFLMFHPYLGKMFTHFDDQFFSDGVENQPPTGYKRTPSGRKGFSSGLFEGKAEKMSA